MNTSCQCQVLRFDSGIHTRIWKFDSYKYLERARGERVLEIEFLDNKNMFMFVIDYDILLFFFFLLVVCLVGACSFVGSSLSFFCLLCALLALVLLFCCYSSF